MHNKNQIAEHENLDPAAKSARLSKKSVTRCLYNAYKFASILRRLFTDLVVHLRHLQFDLFSLQQAVLALFSNRRNQVKLTRHRVRFLFQPNAHAYL